MRQDFLTQEKQIPAPVPACFSPTATRKQTVCGFTSNGGLERSRRRLEDYMTEMGGGITD